MFLVKRTGFKIGQQKMSPEEKAYFREDAYFKKRTLERFDCTARMKTMTIFSGQLHLLHQFKSDFTHLLAFKNLVIELLNAKK